MTLPPFTPPPLILRVSKLDHVPGRPLNRGSGVLSLEDVRNDAQYQKLALDNRRMQKQRGWLWIVVMALAGLLLGVVLLRYQQQKPAVQKPTATAQTPTATTTVAPTPPATTTAATPADEKALDSEIAERWKILELLKTSIEALQNGRQKATPPVAPVPVSPDTLTVIPKMDKTPPAGQEATNIKRAAASNASKGAAITPAPPALPTVKIVDFFGLNKAVMLSISGGDSERTYRIGDVLPSGETITGIDSQAGQMQTSKRTINR